MGFIGLMIIGAFLCGYGAAGTFGALPVQGSIYHQDIGGRTIITIYSKGKPIGSMANVSRATLRNEMWADSIVIEQSK